MAKKKQTPQQRDIERLAKDYQSSLMGLDPEYQSIFDKKQGALNEFQQKSSEYEAKLAKFGEELSEYKKNPLEFVSSAPVEYNEYSQQVFHNVNGSWYETYPRNQLPAGYVIENGKAYKTKATPVFKEASPVAPDLSEYDTEIENIQTKRKTLGQDFEREKSERAASRLRAVSQRSRERPMLSKGVTL
jgi:hypothetical protein